MAAIAAAANAAASAAAAEGTLRPVVEVGRVIPDLGSATILEIGQTYVFAPDVFAFWARFGPDELDWALVGHRRGTLETVAVDARSKAVPATHGRPRMRSVSTFWRRGSNFLAGPDRLFFGEALSFVALEKTLSGGDRIVWSWGAEGRQRVAGPGDKAEFAGREWTLSGAGLLDLDAAGTALLSVGVGSPEKTRGLATWRGGVLSLIALVDQPPPGMPTAKLKDGGNYSVVLGEARLGEDEAIYFRAYVQEPGRKRLALWRISRDSTTPLLTAGDPFPGEPRRTVKTLRLIAVQSSNRYVAYVSGGQWPRNVFLREGERWLELTGEFQLGAEAIDTLFYLSPTGPEIAFLLAFETTQTNAVYRIYELHRGLGFFDGKQLLGLLPGQLFRPLGIRRAPAGGGHRGLLVTGRLAPGQDPTAGPPVDLFLDLSTSQANLQLVPVVATAGGVDIRLDQIERWFGPHTALVRLPAGGGSAATARAAGLHYWTRAEEP